MARVLVVGTGDIGGHLATDMAAQGHQVWGLRRSEKPIGEGVQLITADVSEVESLLDLPTELDIVVYSIASPDFSQEGYHKYYYQGLRNLLNALKVAGQTPKRVFFVSSTSVYHQMEGEWVDENTETNPVNFSGREMLAAENALMEDSVPGTVVRLSGLYGPGRLRMIEQARHGHHCDPEPEVWTNRIHRDDAVGSLLFLIKQALDDQPLENIYLATDHEPATLYDVLEWLKDRIGDVEPDVEMNSVTRRANRRCKNQRLLDAGYQFKYESYQQGYDKILTDMGLV